MMKKLLKITKFLRCGKAHCFIKIYQILIQSLITQIEDLNEDCVKFSVPYLIYFLRNMPPKSVMVRSSQARSDRAGPGPKMIIRLINYI